MTSAQINDCVDAWRDAGRPQDPDAIERLLLHASMWQRQKAKAPDYAALGIDETMERN